jgi:ankyrin repeat protein
MSYFKKINRDFLEAIRECNNSLYQVEYYLKKGANVNARTHEGRTALHIAAEKGNIDLIELLLKYGANVHDKDTENNTALHLSVTFGFAEDKLLYVVKTLLNNGVNVNDTDTRGKTALLIAAGKGYVTIVETLLQNGANVHDTVYEGKTALHIAAEQGNVAIVETLLNYGARIDDTTNNGITALHIAAYTGSVTIVETLLQNAANVHAKTDNGLTALRIAENEAVKIAEYQVDEIRPSFTALNITRRNGCLAVVRLINRALRMKRLRSYAKVVDHFMLFYNNVLETHYAPPGENGSLKPGGRGYLKCKDSFENTASTQVKQD